MTQANSPGDRRKASDEALERAWRIGWRAALSKGLKSEAAKNFVTSVQQSLIVEPRKKAQGVVLDLALTGRARLLRTFADPLGVLMVLLLLFAAGVAASNQDAAGFLLVIIALVAGFVVWIRRFRKWMREAPALLGKLPPSGTAIVANVEGLSVGGTV